MAINFPTSPSLNAIHTENGLSWKYNGNAWLSVATSNTDSVVATGSTQPRSLSDRFADVINVKDFGAVGDGTTDDTAAIQAAIDSVKGVEPTGGGLVKFSKGIYRTNAPLTVYSNVCLLGDGLTRTYIKPLDSATFSSNQAVIQSKNFETTQGTNIWDYYYPYPEGLAMGVGLRELCVDANRTNVSNANGVAIYGGKWNFLNLAVINTSEHGIWTEAGIPNSSTSGDDLHDFINMHEAFSSNIYISNANKHGWLYRGANDSSVGDVQIKTCGWGGFLQESTGNNSVGNLEIRSLHAYSCNCNHATNGAMVTLANANVQFLYVDASYKNGLLINNSASIIDQVLVLKNNQSNSGDYWGVTIDSPAQINCIRNSDVERLSGTDGGLLKINSGGEGSIVGQVRTFQISGTTIAQTGVQLNAPSLIGSFVVDAYDSTGSKGLVINSDKTNVNIQAKSCIKAVSYETAGRNQLSLNAKSCTTDIDYVVASSDTDNILVTSTNKGRAELNTGKLISSGLQLRVNTVGSTTSYAPNLDSVSYIKIVPLTNDISFLQPTNPTEGDVLDILLQQDGTGGRNVTWNSIYKTAFSNSGNTAFTRHHITFVYDGANWVERARTGWF